MNVMAGALCGAGDTDTKLGRGNDAKGKNLWSGVLQDEIPEVLHKGNFQLRLGIVKRAKTMTPPYLLPDG